MKKLLLTTIGLVLVCTSLGACTRQEYGTAAGGVIGGAAGYAITGGSAVGAGVGAVGGALVGNKLAQ